VTAQSTFRKNFVFFSFSVFDETFFGAALVKFGRLALYALLFARKSKQAKTQSKARGLGGVFLSKVVVLC